LDKLKKIAAVLAEKNKIALICHINPDGDTVGSALALYAVLRKKGKSADIFCADAISEKLKYLPFSDRFNINRERRYDAAVAVDCGDRGRMGVMAEVFDSADIKICVDHHKSNGLTCDYTRVEPEKASTAEIVYALIKAFDESALDKDSATAVYAGILTDTGMFSYPATAAETHRIAADLYGFGIDASDIAYNVLKKTAKKGFLLTHRALSRTRFFNGDRIGVVAFFLRDFEETGAGAGDTEGIVNSVQNIDGVYVAIALTEIDATHYRVSIRTKDPVDASDIAGVFGGGGHRLAAGCRLDGDIEDIVDKLVKAAGDLLV
jgi:phosphoesterase RecJ-like protein